MKEIKNHIKLMCLRVDHWESHIVSEINTNDSKEIEDFFDRFQDVQGVKILIFQIKTNELITFDDVKKVIHNAHVFDYIRKLAADGNKMLTVNNYEGFGIDVGALVKYMLDVK